MTIRRSSGGEKPGAFVSAAGHSMEIARSRVAQAREAAERLDAEALEWLCGPRGLAGGEWIAVLDFESQGKSLFDRPSSVFQALLEATLRVAHEGRGAERPEAALRSLDALWRCGYDLRAEADFAHSLDALGLTVKHLYPFRMPSLSVPMGRGRPSSRDLQVEKEPRRLDPPAAVMELLGRWTAQEQAKSGQPLEKLLERWRSEADSQARRFDLSLEAAAAEPFFAAHVGRLREIAAERLLGDAAAALAPGSARGPGRL
jgi:hypothetical protein